MFLVLYSYFQFGQFKKYTNYVEHTYKVMNTTERLKGSISKIIALRRGFILEPTPETKTQILAEGKILSDLVDSLEYQTLGNNVQTSNIKQIREMIKLSGLRSEQWFPEKDLSIPIDSMRSEIRKAKPHLDAAYARLEKIREIENNFLNIRASLQNDSGRTMPVLLMVTGFMAIIMLVYAFMLISNDLKARLAAKIVLEKNVRDLNLANEELERFAFLASHNLKEPLRKARTFISRLTEEASSADGNARELHKVELSLGRLQTMLDDLLAYTRLLHHQENKELVDLNKVIKAVIKEFEKDIAECGLVTEMTMLPTVQGYPQQVALVFRHLLSNALKYRKQDTTPVVSITSDFNDADSTQVIVFSDNGIGFETKYNQKIFEVFGRLHTKDEYEGTGIGLAICRRAMFNHHGVITVDSKPGVGSKFSLHFPY